MRLIFAGTPLFAARALDALILAGHEIPLVLTQPDRPAGRGLKVGESPVKQVAQTHGLSVAQPETLKTPEAQAMISAQQADVMVVAAYGLLVPKAILDLPRWGCINIHASLLPRWRGAAPIQRAIEAGDTQTGITLMQMEAGLDTGPMLIRLPLDIGSQETAGELQDRLADLGAKAICDWLQQPGPYSGQIQDAVLATYAAKLSQTSARLDWRQPAAKLARQIRAFNPVPGAWCELDGERLKVWQAYEIVGSAPPGAVLPGASGILGVACGDGALALTEVQPTGKRRMPIAAFLSGRPVLSETVLK